MHFFFDENLQAPEWFEEDESKSTKVYVSGLPSTITDEEFEQFVSKCGMVEHDIRTKKSKLKLYKATQDYAIFLVILPLESSKVFNKVINREVTR